MENKSLKFSEYKEQIVKALNDKGASLGIQEPVNLIDGFINQPIYNELTGSFVIGGPTIPMVAVVGNSGRIYFFALKALFPDIKI
ncbi:hypothetical protein COT02_01015 [Candidatus Roizmanbacteria bacterium CG07_land_8_20_14_0_80_34_15]|uniref:Uncharacterized protein n=1 Tax=Candidatus Roizmanbacteria bacterium CG07_land_8_20_14_0_80_34_15 TaxID=1974849 RepID=A0A2M6YV84_9BACT|nr:MAG: hypothetical protein COT02_01015 [Candidatus Roizmanbacteria bacterium CG07_land_8_20_14_0_80_34_15]